MYCPNCGAKNDKNSKFCSSCGTTLEEKKETKKEEVKSTDTSITIDNRPVQIVQPERDGKGIASIILGSISIFFQFLPIPIIGLVLGLKTKDKSTKTPGIVLNAIGLFLSIVVTIIIVFSIIAITIAVDNGDFDDDDDYPVIEEKEKTKKDNKDEKTVADTKIVGNDTFGYVEIPGDWHEFKDVESTKAIQYTNIGDAGYIVTLNTIDQNVTAEVAAAAITEGVKGEGASAYYEADTCGKYTGYAVHAAYPDGKYIVSYIFKAEDNVIHFVSIEGPDKNNDFFDIPNTYRLKK